MNTSARSSHLPVIAGLEITMDKHGRFNLNAIHHASGEGSHKRPSIWRATKQAHELISELEDQSQNSGFGPIEARRGGKMAGTYAHELLAVSYAGWISPKFQLHVNQVFLDYRMEKLPSPEPTTREQQLDALAQRFAAYVQPLSDVGNTSCHSVASTQGQEITIAPEDRDCLYSLCEFTKELHLICQRHQIPRAIAMMGLPDGSRMDVLVAECRDIAMRLQYRYLTGKATA